MNREFNVIIERDSEGNYVGSVPALRGCHTQELLSTLQVERPRTEEEFIAILRRIVRESDDKKTLLEKINDVFILQPNFMGVGIDVNALISEFLKGRKK